MSPLHISICKADFVWPAVAPIISHGVSPTGRCGDSSALPILGATSLTALSSCAPSLGCGDGSCRREAQRCGDGRTE